MSSEGSTDLGRCLSEVAFIGIWKGEKSRASVKTTQVAVIPYLSLSLSLSLKVSRGRGIIPNRHAAIHAGIITEHLRFHSWEWSMIRRHVLHLDLPKGAESTMSSVPLRL